MKKLLLIAAFCMLFLSGCGEHEHTPGAEATCTEPQICSKCGEVLADAIGHRAPSVVACTDPTRCMNCGAWLADAVGHTPGPEPTCTTAQVCEVCGIELAPALGHTAAEGPCTKPVLCAVCEEEIGPAPGHVPGEASCTAGVACMVCGDRLEKAPGHAVDNSTGICTVCEEQVIPAGYQYVAPGAHGSSDEGAANVLPETLNEGHYNPGSTSYYSKSVLITGDYGLEYFTMDPTGSSRYASIINGFAEKYPQLNVTSLLTPKCAAYYSPADRTNPHDSIVDFISSTYEMMNESVKKADVVSYFEEHAGEYLFYRTDHHWTSLGAYYAACAYCDANGITPLDLNSYETVIRTGVSGSLSYYSGYASALNTNPDYTACHFPQTGYTMRYLYAGGWYNGVALNAENKGYAYVFINGDMPLTVFETDNKNGKALMIFKESYGNAFVPYMIDYYERIVVVDFREKTESVASLIERYGITDALIINNVQGATGLMDSLKSKLMS